MKIEIRTSNGKWEELKGVGVVPVIWEPTYVGSTPVGAIPVRASITIHADMTEYNRSLDKARRYLFRLRYPPKQPAKGTVSRRREKLRKAGLR